MAVMGAGKHAHAHGHAHLHHHAAAQKPLHAAFSFPLFSDVGIVHPSSASVNRLFAFLSIFPKKKKFSLCYLCIGQGFFCLFGVAAEKTIAIPHIVWYTDFICKGF